MESRKDRRIEPHPTATRWAPLRSKLPEFGTRGEFHLKRRAFARRRLHPDAAAMHLHDLFGNGEAKTGATLCLGKGAVDLVSSPRSGKPTRTVIREPSPVQSAMSCNLWCLWRLSMCSMVHPGKPCFWRFV